MSFECFMCGFGSCCSVSYQCRFFTTSELFTNIYKYSLQYCFGTVRLQLVKHTEGKANKIWPPDITVDECHFIGVIILMSYNDWDIIKDYWSFDKLYCVLFCSKILEILPVSACILLSECQK